MYGTQLDAPRRGVSRRVASALAAAGLAAGIVVPIAATPAAAAPAMPALTFAKAPPPAASEVPSGADPVDTYVVQMSDLPVGSYGGQVAGYRSTRPTEAGAKADTKSAAASSYKGYLESKQNAAASSARNAKVLYHYTSVFNGFSAKMPASSAAKLARQPGVVAVTKDTTRRVQTTDTPAFLGISKPGGLWDHLGGPQYAGSGVVVGVLDTGIWPESASFAPLKTPGKPQVDFGGVCQAGDQFPASTCNNKLIGARYYTEGNGGPAGIKANLPGEIVSARDTDGHGSHTASTAAGDYNVPVVINGTNLGNASGMAPNARIAAYKVCWGDAGCKTVDILAAIDDAIDDGVDVINFSIGGSTPTFTDPIEISFLFAADAGVFVAASAGNSGPGPSTLDHPSPWETTVAAGTHDRALLATVSLGNGAKFTGAGSGAAVPSSPIILASQAGKPGVNADGLRLCFSKEWDPATPGGYLDPAKVAGKIVVCDRGVSDRIDKSLAVKEAGGVGMVLTNTSVNSLNADIHSVPTVHLSNTDGDKVKAYVSGTAHPTASLSASVKSKAEAPQVAAFSSRGPNLVSDGDILKPDIMAPGVDVLAAVSPLGHQGRNFDFISGTSMASPHIAGLGALLKQARPKFSPMAIKSALMTTASTVDNQGKHITYDFGGNANALDYGSGQVTPNLATFSGLVYDSGFVDWVQYLCGTGDLDPNGSTCGAFGTIDPSNLNTPNIAIGAMPGAQTVTRTVTNVGTAKATYTAKVTAPPGVKATVSPSTLTIGAGRSATFSVTFTRTTAPLNAFSFGTLLWTDGSHNVRSQLAVRPVVIAAPGQVSGTGTSGSAPVKVQPGYTGVLTASLAGLVPSATTTLHLCCANGAAFNTAAPAANAHVGKTTVTVPAGAKLGRFSTFADQLPDGTDVDMFVYKAGTATLVGISAGGTASETVDVTAAGSYDVYVDLFSTAPGVTNQDVVLHSWSVTGSAGNASVAPASQAVSAGQFANLTVSWSGLATGKRFLGLVSYGNGTSTIGTTAVRVDT